MAISALSSDTINKRNLQGMGDYLSTLPGVTVLDQGPGFNSVVIRGLGAKPQSEGASSSPVTGVYFGETAISGFGIAGNSADIKLVDMHQIEVLRGPQGTLYGAGAMGGVVRNIPTAPNLEQVEGKLQVGFSNTGEEGGNNNITKGIINIPLIEDVLALRAVAYRFDTSGYYKNVAASDPVTLAAVAAHSAVAVDQDDIGSNEVTGGRISALWQPMDQLSINLSYLTQDTNQDGWGQAELDLDGFSQRRLGVRSGKNPPYSGAGQQEDLTDDIEITNLTIEYDLDWATVTSSTSRVDERSLINRDLSAFFGDTFPFSQSIIYDASLISQEIRLTSSLDGPWEFLVGLYHEEKKTGFDSSNLFGGSDLSLNRFAPNEIFIGRRIDRRKLDQQAVFGELSYNISDEVKLTLGARVFDYDREFSITRQNADGSFTVPGTTDSSENDASFKAGIEYTPNDEALLYASWSEGFRVGFPVAAESAARQTICDTDNDGFYDGSNGISTGDRLVASDFVENFELGAKLALLDDRLNVNTAVYEINWEGIPISQVFEFCFAIANAGEARSRGVELDVSYSFDENLLVNFSSSYVDAELTIDAPRIGGSKGDRLPGSARTNASLGLEYRFTIDRYDAYLRSDYSYVGGFYNNLQQMGTEAGDYSKVNIKAGITIDQFDIDLFVDNLTNDDSVSWVDSEIPNRGNRLKPRTIGLNVAYQF